MTETSRQASFQLRPFVAASTAAHAMNIEVDLTISGGMAQLCYRATGAWERLRLGEKKEPAVAGFTSMLWQHTCFEFFLARPGSDHYLEFNFAACGDYAYYLFDGYRHLAAQNLAPELAPVIALEEGAPSAPQLVLHADFSWQAATALLEGAQNEPLLINIAAVTEECDGTMRHWALQHKGERADFHRRDGFIVWDRI